MAEVICVRFKGRIRCSYCHEDKPYRKDGINWGGYSNREGLNRERETSLREYKSGWFKLEPKERRLVKRKRTMHTLKSWWFCPDCFRDYVIPLGERDKGVLESLFVSGKILRFKKSSQAHEVASG